MTFLKRALLVGILALSTTVAAAPQLTLETITEREVSETDDKGNLVTKRVETTGVEPGDTLYITLQITNTGDEDATSINIENPVPQGTELVPDSPWGKNTTITYSADNGQQFAAADAVTVPRNTIGLSTRPATFADYTHIRWVIERVEAGQSTSVGFSAVVK